MDVANYQRTFVRICFARDADAADVDALGGNPERWHMYRRMVRARLRRLIQDGMPRTVHALGAAFDDIFSDYLDARAPDSRFFRDVIGAFDGHLQRNQPPGLVRDASAYERARWEVRDLLPSPTPPMVGFSFDAPPVVNNDVLWLDVAHAVWKPDVAERVSLPSPQTLIVCRTPEETVRTVVVPTPLAHVLRAWSEGEGTATTLARQAGEAHGFDVDPPFVGELCAHLEVWLERGLILGSAA